MPALNALTAAAAALAPLTAGPQAPQDASAAQVSAALGACAFAFAGLTGGQTVPAAADTGRPPFLTLSSARAALLTPAHAPGSTWAQNTAAQLAPAVHALARLAAAHQLAQD